jgi:hypothetical protein
LYGWLTLPDPSAGATVGRPVELEADPQTGRGPRVLDRCENCGLGVESGGDQVDLEAEARAISTTLDDGSPALVAANRASVQATIGGEGWAAIEARPGRLLHSPRSLRLLAERTGDGLADIRCSRFGRNQAWMWQTLVNGLTFHPNFARDVRAGRLRARTARSRITFAIDCVVTALAAPLVLLASVPLELVSALAGRGGELVGRR